MMDKMVRSRVAGVLLALALTVMLLAGVLYFLPTNDAYMLFLLKRHSTPASSGLPEEAYPVAAEMIAAYLEGNIEEFQIVYMKDGVEYAAFNEREQQHMADVQKLFALCRTVGLWGTSVSVVSLVSLLIDRDRKALRYFRRGILGILALVTIVAMWAVIDFDSIFVLFHRIAFTNELWLLDPRTSMLIRLMPTNFFVEWVVLIGIVWLIGMLLAIILSWPVELLLKLMNRKDENP